MDAADSGGFPRLGLLVPPAVALVAGGLFYLAMTLFPQQVHIHSLAGFLVLSAFWLVFGFAMLVELASICIAAIALSRHPSERAPRNISLLAFGAASFAAGAMFITVSLGS